MAVLHLHPAHGFTFLIKVPAGSRNLMQEIHSLTPLLLQQQTAAHSWLQSISLEPTMLQKSPAFIQFPTQSMKMTTPLLMLMVNLMLATLILDKVFSEDILTLTPRATMVLLALILVVTGNFFQILQLSSS